MRATNDRRRRRLKFPGFGCDRLAESFVVDRHKDYWPQMDTDDHRLENRDPLSQSVIGAAFEVSRVLGPGFLEKVYERAMARELALRGLRVEQQVAFSVHYKTQPVGNYIADLVVEGKVLVELKCVERFAPEHMAQCINYLKASGLRLALMLNFQKARVEWKRVVYG